jgi:mono/diheme cytochrome c family protein
MRTSPAVSIAALSLLLGVGVCRGQDTPPNRERADLAIQARSILRTYCFSCHGGGKSRSTLTILDHAQLVAAGPNPVPFVAPKNPGGSQLIQFIEDGSMPPGGKARPTGEEVAVLKRWVMEDAPRFPLSFDANETARVILEDIGRLKAEDLPHARYLSLTHLLKDETPTDLGKAQGNLQRALRLAGVTVPPVPVDDAATVFRLDARTAGWDNTELFYRVAAGTPRGINPLTPYDVLLLEYPYGTVPTDKRFDDYLAKAKLHRPIPYLRGDWVATALMDEKQTASPLAEDLKSLSELSAALRKDGAPPPMGEERNMPCGPTSRAFAGRNPVAPAPTNRSPLPIPPLGSWYLGDVQPDPPPFPLTVELIDRENKVLKTVTTDQPFRLRVSTRRNVRFTLLQVWADGTVRIQPTNKNGFLDRDESILTPDGSDWFKITGILTGEPKATEYFVLFVTDSGAESEPAPLTIVRSRHAAGPNCEDEKRFPIHRFFFEPDKRPQSLDTSRIIRKVIPVTIVKAD